MHCQPSPFPKKQRLFKEMHCLEILIADLSAHGNRALLHALREDLRRKQKLAAAIAWQHWPNRSNVEKLCCGASAD